MRKLTDEDILNGNVYSADEVNNLSTERLSNLYHKVRRLAMSYRFGRVYRCCSMCNAWIGTAEQYEEHVVKPSAKAREFSALLKSKLNDRLLEKPKTSKMGRKGRK